MSRRSDYDFFFDASGAPAVSRRPESLEGEHHARLDFDGVLERDETADYRLLPDGEADAVSVLQGEGGFFVGETEILRLGPHGRDFGSRAAGTNEFDRGIQIFAAALVGVDHGVRCGA